MSIKGSWAYTKTMRMAEKQMIRVGKTGRETGEVARSILCMLIGNGYTNSFPNKIPASGKSLFQKPLRVFLLIG